MIFSQGLSCLQIRLGLNANLCSNFIQYLHLPLALNERAFLTRQKQYLSEG